MRKHDHLLNPLGHRQNFLAGAKRTMLIEAGHRIIYHNDFVRKVGILLQGRKEKCKGQRVPITGAQSVLERRPRISTDVDGLLIYYNAV